MNNKSLKIIRVDSTYKFFEKKNLDQVEEDTSSAFAAKITMEQTTGPILTKIIHFKYNKPHIYNDKNKHHISTKRCYKWIITKARKLMH